MHVGWGSVEDEWTRKMHEYTSEKSPVRWGSTGGDKWVHAWTDGEGKQSERQTGIIKMHQRDTGIKYLLPIWVCVFLWAVAGNCPYYSSCPKTSPLHATDTHTHTHTDWLTEREREWRSRCELVSRIKACARRVTVDKCVSEREDWASQHHRSRLRPEVCDCMSVVCEGSSACDCRWVCVSYSTYICVSVRESLGECTALRELVTKQPGYRRVCVWEKQSVRKQLCIF